MKWTYIIRQKIKAALALGTVFLLVIATNLMDKSHFSQLAGSFSSVYKDRLMVENYIFKFSNIMHKKQEFAESYKATRDARFLEKMRAPNDSIKALMKKYEKTKLTEAEARTFNDLKINIAQLLSLEEKYYQDPTAQSRTAMQEQYQKISHNLKKLSEIQITAGKAIVNKSQKIISNSDVTSQLEIVILIIIGLVIQGLIVSSGFIPRKLKQKPPLN